MISYFCSCGIEIETGAVTRLVPDYSWIDIGNEYIYIISVHTDIYSILHLDNSAVGGFTLRHINIIFIVHSDWSNKLTSDQ